MKDADSTLVAPIALAQAAARDAVEANLPPVTVTLTFSDATLAILGLYLAGLALDTDTAQEKLPVTLRLSLNLNLFRICKKLMDEGHRVESEARAAADSTATQN